MNSPATHSRSPRPKSQAYVLIGGIVILVAAVILVIVGYSTRSHVTQPAAIAPADVSVGSAGFSPAQVTVKKGQAVTWTNSDTNTHSVVSDSPTPLFKSEDLKADDTFSYVFSAPASTKSKLRLMLISPPGVERSSRAKSRG